MWRTQPLALARIYMAHEMDPFEEKREISETRMCKAYTPNQHGVATEGEIYILQQPFRGQKPQGMEWKDR